MLPKGVLCPFNATSITNKTTNILQIGNLLFKKTSMILLSAKDKADPIPKKKKDAELNPGNLRDVCVK